MAYLLMNERKNFAKTIKENLNSDINEHDIVNILTTIQSLGFYIIPKCKYKKDGIYVNADSENLANYCFLNNAIGCLMEELKNPSQVRVIEFFIKHNAKVREGMAVEILKKAKEIEKDFDKTGLYEYIVANFLKEIKEE